MTRDEIQEIFDSSCRAPIQAEMESACDRVFQRLKIHADEAPQEILEDPAWNHPVRAWWQIRPIWLVTAVAALVLISMPLARRFVANRNVYAIVENEDGPRYRVAARQLVATDVWTRLTVTLPDGSRVEMHPQSQLSVNGAADGLRIRLDKGGIIVTAARQRSGHLYVDTKDMSVSVVGTVFLVAVEEAGSSVGVLDGKVLVKQGGLTRTLLPPEQMATNPLMELSSLREQVAWSRYAQEHLALLPQDIVPTVAKQTEKPVEIMQAQAPSKPPQLNPPNPAASRPQFEVASVKHNNSGSQAVRLDGDLVGRYRATNAPLRLLIQVAYKVQDFQIIGAPAWIDSERYDIEAKAEGALSDQTGGPMLQALIEERFRAAMHGETRDLPVYFLTVAKSGSKLKAQPCLTREPGTPVPPGQPQSAFCGYMGINGGSLEATGAQMQVLASFLSGILKRKVLDRTGLTGGFDVKLKWTPDLGTPGNTPAPSPDGGPSLFTAIEEQLGLKLESGKAPIDVLVIDHIDHASDN
jgi:uncharacterized protein (TIGR03435 family)